VTPVVIVCPLLDAVKACVCPAGTAATAGFKRSPCAAETVKVAVPVKLPEELVAVTVTVAALVGAVNKPELLMDPPPLTLHVNVAVGWLAAKAVNCAFPLTGTVATAGKMATSLGVTVVLVEPLVELPGGLLTLTLLLLHPVRLAAPTIAIRTRAFFNRFGRKIKGRSPVRFRGDELRERKIIAAIAGISASGSNPLDDFRNCSTNCWFAPRFFPLLPK
jgi:hypothetical protein